MKVQRDKNKLIVDIHGMRVEPARFRLETTIQSCNAEVTEIVVIHGYNSGQALKDMVRDLQAPRIKQIRATLNEGQTIIDLKKK
ncbi:MAG: Smr/MutS family protein [Clostridiales bacterium]|nr:Smr/MutS family protein [Clostridiales bacterium]